MLKNIIILSAVFLLVGISHAQEEKKVAPLLLPHVSPAMLTAGFWINSTPDVDKPLMSEQDRLALNQDIVSRLKLTKDIFTLIDDLRTENLIDELNNQFNGFVDKGYYTAQGVRDDNEFLEKTKQNMHLSAVVMGVEPSYGLIVKRVDQRLLPTDKPLYEKPDDIYFDQIQNSGLELGEAVAVVHASRDKRWLYVLGKNSDGWVDTKAVAIGDKSVVEDYIKVTSFVVVTDRYVDVYLDNKMTQWVASVRMGEQLPLIERADEITTVQIPQRTGDGKLNLIPAYILSKAVHEGYLPLTQRSIFNQALTWLHTPYGWGDNDGFPDCSRLIASVYATMGIVLPRDSKNQAQVGVVDVEFNGEEMLEEKNERLVHAKPGSLLTLKGHIMLYLGTSDGVPYAIHATSGYRQKGEEHDTVLSLMRVTISDLSLGERSSKGSLLKRLSRIVRVIKPVPH